MDQEAQPPTARRRGRPPGTGRDDSRTLTAVADILRAHPGMKATTAMRRQAGGTATDSNLRRLQVKWKAEGSRLMAEAEARAHERERRQQDHTRSASATAAAMAVHVIGMAHPALAAAERHALMLGITGGIGEAYSTVMASTRAFQEAGRIGQAYSAVTESTRAFQEAARIGQVHDVVSAYACGAARLDMGLTGSAAAALGRELADLGRVAGVTAETTVLGEKLADLSRIAGVVPETSMSKHLRELAKDMNRFADPLWLRQRG